STSSSNIRCRSCCMLCRAKTSSVSQVGLDAATDSVLFFPTGGVSFCSGVDRARGSFGEPKVTPPFLVYTLSDVTSPPPDHYGTAPRPAGSRRGPSHQPPSGGL